MSLTLPTACMSNVYDLSPWRIVMNCRTTVLTVTRGVIGGTQNQRFASVKYTPRFLNVWHESFLSQLYRWYRI